MPGWLLALTILGAIGSICSIIQFLVALKYDLNTQLFLKVFGIRLKVLAIKHVWPPLSAVLLCFCFTFLSGALTGGIFYLIIWKIILVHIINLVSPADLNCVLTASDPSVCYKSTIFEPIAQILAYTIAGIYAISAGRDFIRESIKEGKPVNIFK